MEKLRRSSSRPFPIKNPRAQQSVSEAALSSTDQSSVDEALVEAGHPPKHLLAVGVQLLQLVLDQNRIQRRTLLDQVLPEHDQSVDLLGVEGDFLLEGLQAGGTRGTKYRTVI